MLQQLLELHATQAALVATACAFVSADMLPVECWEIILHYYCVVDVQLVGTYEAGLLLKAWSRISTKARACLSGSTWAAMVVHNDVLHRTKPDLSDRRLKGAAQLMLRTVRDQRPRAQLTPMFQLTAHPAKPDDLKCKHWSWLTWNGPAQMQHSTPMTLAMLVWNETKPSWAPWASFIVEWYFDAAVTITQSQAMSMYHLSRTDLELLVPAKHPTMYGRGEYMYLYELIRVRRAAHDKRTGTMITTVRELRQKCRDLKINPAGNANEIRARLAVLFFGHHLLPRDEQEEEN